MDPPPHAFHRHLPEYCKDEDGVPFVTRYAQAKVQEFISLAFSIELQPSMFEVATVDDDDSMEHDEEDEDDSMPMNDEESPCETLDHVMKRCGRLNSLFLVVEPLKPAKIPVDVLCKLILHLLKLLTATIHLDGVERDRKATLYYENVGYIWENGSSEPVFQAAKSREELSTELKRRFALPVPTREALLVVLLNLMRKKGHLQEVSNSSIYVNGDTKDRQLLILHWQPLLRTLLRTAPYLDEYSTSDVVRDSSSRTGTILKRTVQLIRDARHYFEQGIVQSEDRLDQSAVEIWDMLESDVRFHSHTHACYRGTILLYLFLPTRCSSGFYERVLPHWFDSWTNIDRCPEYDFLWLTLLCRARKHVNDSYDWTMVRKRILSLSQYWLQLPIGGAALDKSFPKAPTPRTRVCPSRLKVFVGSGSSYSEGIDFVSKVSKLLVSGLGMGPPAASSEESQISEGTYDVLRFLSFVSPYFNPSNIGRWTYSLGAFLQAFSFELCSRLGRQIGQESLQDSHPAYAEAHARVQPCSAHELPPNELVHILEALMPLCQQALYSKNGNVSRCGEMAMRSLACIDPRHTTPSFIDFACQALDISAINQSHQAPAALSTLARLIQPALRIDHSIIFQRLPQLFHLTLAGIDSNDYDKTTRTLIFYRTLASWVPLGGSEVDWKIVDDRNQSNAHASLSTDVYARLQRLVDSTQYTSAIDGLPETSLLRACRNDNVYGSVESAIHESSFAASDWVLEFLDRIYMLMRSAGSKEKSSERNGVRHGTSRVLQARNFSRVLKETLMQVFASIDDKTFTMALRSVCRFVEDETLPWAAKDCSILCEAVAACRDEGGTSALDALVPLLCRDVSQLSNKTATYRLRCLGGSVRSSSGRDLIKHKPTIAKAVAYALSSDDKHLFKTGCKLMRHLLTRSLESSVKNCDARPRIFRSKDGTLCFGRSAQLHEDEPQWQNPTDDLIKFACELIEAHVVTSINACWEAISDKPKIANDLNRIRGYFKIIQYAIRGGSSAFLDEDAESGTSSGAVVPHESAGHVVLKIRRSSLFALRKQLCTIIIAYSRLVSMESYYIPLANEASVNKSGALYGFITDPKLQKQLCSISALLLSRRGAGFRAQETGTLWRAKKRLMENHTISSVCSYICKVLCTASALNADKMSYKDGEDSGKTLSRQLLITRLQIFVGAIQCSASYEIPRRLRKLQRNQQRRRILLYSVPDTKDAYWGSVRDLAERSDLAAIDAYEGIIDGLYSFCCHSNESLNDAALRGVVSAWSRFGWTVRERTPRLIAAVSLCDGNCHGKYGLPSCMFLKGVLDAQGKRKRLADAIKGICQILGQSRSTKVLLQTHKLRWKFIQMIFKANDTVSLLPDEDSADMITCFFLLMFSPFRSKLYTFPTATTADVRWHRNMLQRSISTLIDSNDGYVVSEHWRKKLIACWVLLATVDIDELEVNESRVKELAWMCCFGAIENERGQPIQRLALGLMGRLVALHSNDDRVHTTRLVEKNFVKSFGDAIVFDHREDSSFGGQHDAQWAVGIEELVREAGRNIAPRTLFPFQRTNQVFAAFKASHANLVETLLGGLHGSDASQALENLLAFARQCFLAPPSEDHRNQQAAAAEIFAGICGSFLRRPQGTYSQTWGSSFLPHLENAMNSLPLSFCGAYFDALRYALQFCNPKDYQALTEWLAYQVESTLWQPDDELSTNASHLNTTDGFTTQSKWLYLFSSLMIELDETELGRSDRSLWYQKHLALVDATKVSSSEPLASAQEPSWNIVHGRVLPRLLLALGHPFESCRENISQSLFRICYCHRKHERDFKASNGQSTENKNDVGCTVVEALSGLDQRSDTLTLERLNALNTARRFISQSVRLGEAKFEYSEYVIPLLSLAFRSIRSSTESELAENDTGLAALRSTEAELIKNFKYTIAEISVTAVISYGRDSDIGKVLDAVAATSKDEHWHVRHTTAHFLRCFQSAHCFKFTDEETLKTTDIIADMLADGRQEVSSAATSALIGILASTPLSKVSSMVSQYSAIATKSKKRSKVRNAGGVDDELRAHNQQKAVFFLCAAVLSQPYNTPKFVPIALAAISKHSFEKNAPLRVRSVVKRCCAEYKRTHMSDDWSRHRKAFTAEQLDALDDVVSTPHYYA